MRAVIGLSLLLIAGVLMYEAVKGNALNIMNAIKGGAASTSNNGAAATPMQTPQNIQTTPNNPPGGIFKA